MIEQNTKEELIKIRQEIFKKCLEFSCLIVGDEPKKTYKKAYVKVK